MENEKSSLESEIEEYISENSDELIYLAKLHKWLNKNIVDNRLDNWIMVASPFLLPLILLSMLLFTPLMFKTLKIFKRKGWIIGLSVIVLLPLLLVFFIDVFEAKALLIGMSMIGYFMFCGIIWIEVDDWYKEMKAKIRREQLMKNKEFEVQDNWIIMRY